MPNEPNLNALSARLRAYAQNEEMTDERSLAHGKDCMAAAHALHVITLIAKDLNKIGYGICPDCLVNGYPTPEDCPTCGGGADDRDVNGSDLVAMMGDWFDVLRDEVLL